ncbi:MAG: SIS domain-containing protein [Clostridia bacterium]|nr:SIS domain-containing protein [Clostridia bacterium]
MPAQDRYYHLLRDMLNRAFTEQAEAIETAAQRIADTVLSGGTLYTFGTGHGHLLALEIFYRAGGLVRVCPMLDERLMLHISASESSEWERKEGLAAELLQKYPVKAGDTVLITSNSGRNAVPVEMAVACREKGAFVIALTNMKHSSAVSPRNALRLRLFEAADLTLDNMGVLGDACVAGTGGRMVGPTSTAVGAALLQAIVCRVEEIARERGQDIEYFASSNIDGGDAINAAYLEKYKGHIPAL